MSTTVKHEFVSLFADGADTSFLRPSDWNAVHVVEDTASVTYYGAVGDGTTDDSGAFQVAVDAVGTPYVPAGSYYLDTPILLKKTGDGLRCAGSSLVTLIGNTGIVAPDPAQSASIRSCHLSGFSCEPLTATVHAGENDIAYADYDAIDLTGISDSLILDVLSRNWKRNLVLDYSVYQTYKNLIVGFRASFGSVGIYLGGNASPNDGANANVFLGCSLKSLQKFIQILGGINTFVGLGMENPLQTSGYPLTSIGIEFEKGFYAVNNTFTSTYLELAGTGNTAIRVTGAGTGWVTPNRFEGGTFSANGAYVDEITDAGNSAVGFHLDAAGLGTRRISYDIDTAVSVSRHYDEDGGYSVQKYDSGVGAIVTLVRETYGTAVPSAGTWIRGARVWNTEATAAGTMGWVCVTAGTPGTWKTFGTIES